MVLTESGQNNYSGGSRKSIIYVCMYVCMCLICGRSYIHPLLNGLSGMFLHYDVFFFYRQLFLVCDVIGHGYKIVFLQD